MLRDQWVSVETMQINSTDLAGFLAFIPAALASGLAALTSKELKGGSPRMWRTITALYVCLAVELAAKTRYVVDDRLREFLRGAHEYSGLRIPQAVTLLAILASTLVLSFLAIRYARSWAAAVAGAASLALVGLFIAESVSLHAMDATLYARRPNFADRLALARVRLDHCCSRIRQSGVRRPRASGAGGRNRTLS